MHAPTPSALALADHCLGRADTVICLHSSTGSQAQWRPLVQALTPRWQALALDLYGHGRSPAWPADAPNTLDVDAATVLALMQGLDDGDEPSRGVHLVGHSYGAAVALRVAMRQPQRVRSLTLYEPVVFGLLPATAGEYPVRHEIVDIALSVGALVKAGALADAARVFVGYWGGPKAWGGMNEAQQATVLHRIATVPRHFEALFAATWHLRQLRRLQMPVLLLQGSNTRAPARRVTELLLQALPQAQGRVIAGAGHLGPITHAEPVLAAMRAHLDPGSMLPAPLPSTAPGASRAAMIPAEA